ncbi:MAG: hypothetical protein ACE5KP_07690 [Dehalococcoidales bacterium]
MLLVGEVVVPLAGAALVAVVDYMLVGMVISDEPAVAAFAETWVVEEPMLVAELEPVAA